MIRVLVVDDHEGVRDSLAALLDAAADVVVAGTGATGPAALVQAEALRPDVVVLDVAMSVLDGLRTAAQLGLRHPRGRVVMVSVSVPAAAVRRARAVGAVGYVCKTGDAEDLLTAVRVVAAGGEWWCEQAAAVLALTP
jgi:two-component system, NarL family, invasion response regulator UvrY